MIWQRLSPPRGGRTSKLLLIFQYALQIRCVDRLKCTGLLSKDRQRYSFRNFRIKNYYYRKQYREQVVQQRVGERVVEQRNFVEKSLPFPFFRLKSFFDLLHFGGWTIVVIILVRLVISFVDTGFLGICLNINFFDGENSVSLKILWNYSYQKYDNEHECYNLSGCS
jgi:hypothetical protein